MSGYHIFDSVKECPKCQNERHSSKSILLRMTREDIARGVPDRIRVYDHSGVKMEYGHFTDHGTQRVDIPGNLEVICLRCGYSWIELSADACESGNQGEGI